MRKLWIIAVIAVASLVFSQGDKPGAQPESIMYAIVVSACGIPPQTYNPGVPALLTMEPNGNLCIH